MRTSATVLTASRKKKGKEVDQVTQLPTPGFDQEKNIEVLLLVTKIFSPTFSTYHVFILLFL